MPQRQVKPPNNPVIAQAAKESAQQVQGESTNFDDILFAGTDHPNEPITTGAPFGPGASFVRQPAESDDQFLTRVSGEVANAPGASARVRAFAARVARGE